MFKPKIRWKKAPPPMHTFVLFSQGPYGKETLWAQVHIVEFKGSFAGRLISPDGRPVGRLRAQWPL